MNHANPCITNVLDDMPSCTTRNEHFTTCNHPECTGCWPQPATHGEVCDTCYTRIDHAIGVADHLRAALKNVDHAITTDSSNRIAGPRLPMTIVQLDLVAINLAQARHTDPHTWVQTEHGAAQAVRFARLVHHADRAHPTIETERKLHRLRCPRCNRLTATWQPPTWPGDDVHITCIDTTCGWQATHPDAIDIVNTIEARGAA